VASMMRAKSSGSPTGLVAPLAIWFACDEALKGAIVWGDSCSNP